MNILRLGGWRFFVVLCMSLVLLQGEAFANNKANKNKAKALIKQHKLTIKKLKALKISPAVFAALAGAGNLTDSDGDGLPDFYEEAKAAYNSCDTDSDDDGDDDGEEGSSSSSSGGSSSSSSGSSSGGSSSSGSSSSDDD